MMADFSGLSGSDIEIEMEKRAAVLEWMGHKGLRNIFEVGNVIQEYYRDPENVLKRIRSEKGAKRQQ
jgi:flagellar protein FlaI